MFSVVSKLFTGVLSGLTGPLGTLAGVFIDKIVNAIWVRLEAKWDANKKFSGDVKEISQEATKLNEELDSAVQPEEYKAILKKISAFQDRVSHL